MSNFTTIPWQEYKLSWIFIVPAHWNNSPWLDMSLHLDTLSWFWANLSLLLLLNTACLVEKQQILWMSFISWMPIFMIFEKGTIFYKTFCFSVQHHFVFCTTLFCEVILYNTIFSVQHHFVFLYNTILFFVQHYFVFCTTLFCFLYNTILWNYSVQHNFFSTRPFFLYNTICTTWYSEKFFCTTLYCLSVEVVLWHAVNTLPVINSSLF